MTTETLKTELTRLEKGFESFQENHATRLSMLEKKMGARPASVMLEDGGTVATRDTPTARKAFANFLRGAGAVKSLTAGDAPGSYLLPSVVQERIERALDASETFRQIARHMTISSGSVEVIIDRDLPSVGWTSEVVERTETDPGQLARIKIDLHELYAKPKITQKILDDAAINVEDWIVDKVSQKMKQIEEQAFIVGDGDGKPRGFLTYETGETSRFGRLQHIKTGEDGGFGEQGTDALFNLVDSLKQNT
ncbi:MAG: phage major capsid protein [Holosporaceae bacterium]|nr:MAG: phage major capsid protein [Holosporaceae bacterium]